MAEGAANQQPIIIKKVKGHGHGHHGGAWKVAYADFVTAMMAFFLLLWLLNATTEEQRKGIADYFSPESLSSPNSGAGGILGGKTVAIDGAQVSAGGPSEGGTSVPLPPQIPAEGEEGADGEDLADGEGGETDLTENGTSEFAETGTSDKPENGIVDEGALEEALAAREQEQFEAAAEMLRQAISSVPELVALQDSLLIEQTPRACGFSSSIRKAIRCSRLAAQGPTSRPAN